MQKILITGSSGHLGSRVLCMLRTRYEVHAIVRSRPSVPLPGVEYHEIDLSREWSTRTLPDQMDAVIHLAQARNYRDFPACALATYQVSTGSTALLLDYAQRVGVAHFILASTGGLYPPGGRVIDNLTPVNPPQGSLSYYFRTKYCAEQLAESYVQLFDVSVLRPFFIYGPGQSSEKLIARLIASVRDSQPIQLAGEAGLRINPVHVVDVAELLLALLTTNGSRTLNVAGPDVVSIRQIAEDAGRFLSRVPVFEHSGADAKMIVAEHHTVAALLGRNLIHFTDGLRSQIYPEDSKIE